MSLVRYHFSTPHGNYTHAGAANQPAAVGAAHGAERSKRPGWAQEEWQCLCRVPAWPLTPLRSVRGSDCRLRRRRHSPFFRAGGPHRGSISSAFHFCHIPASSATFSGILAARSVCSPTSSLRLNSLAPSTVAFSRRRAAPPPPARPPPVAAFTSFQSPARTASCPPNRQYRASCGGVLTSPRKYGSRLTPSSLTLLPSGSARAADRTVGNRSS